MPFPSYKDPDGDRAPCSTACRPSRDRLLRPQGRAGLRAPGWLRRARRSWPRTSSATLADLLDVRTSTHATTRSTPRSSCASACSAASRACRSRPTATGATPRPLHLVGARGRPGGRHLPAAVPRARGAAGPAGGASRTRAGEAWPRRILAEADRVARGGRRRAHLAARPDLRAGALRPRRLRASAASASWRRASSTWRWRSALPELRIDPLSGLRVIVAGERGDAAGRLARRRARGRRSTPSATPSARATRTGRRPRSTRCATASARDSRVAVRVVPNLYPALDPAASRRRARTRWPPAAASPTCSPRGRRSARTR